MNNWGDNSGDGFWAARPTTPITPAAADSGDPNAGLAVGDGARVGPGFAALAIGVNTLALLDQATAIGAGANAGATNTTAVGPNSAATQTNGIAVGPDSVADAEGAIAIGTAIYNPEPDSFRGGVEGVSTFHVVQGLMKLEGLQAGYELPAYADDSAEPTNFNPGVLIFNITRDAPRVMTAAGWKTVVLA